MTLYPLHLKPKDDELLSSWIARLASAHGLTPTELGRILKPVIKSNLWMLRDIDLGTKDAVFSALLTKLSTVCATPLARVHETTLTEYEGRLYEKVASRKTYTWILPYNLNDEPDGQRFGTQACPLCLAEDGEPYFRRHWRLAFVVACLKHNLLLIDRCSGCGQDIRFHLNTADHLKRMGMMSCRKCGFDLRETPVQPPVEVEVAHFQERLIAALKNGYVEIEGIENTSSTTYFAVLHWMLSVVIEPNELLHDLQDSIFTYYGLNLNISFLPKKHALETLDVTTRYELMWLLHRMLIDHPDRYLRDTDPYQPSSPSTLMSRIWYSKCLRTPAWLLPMMYVERNRLQAGQCKQIDTEQDAGARPYKSRPQGLDDAGNYGDRKIYPQFFDSTVNGRRKKQQNYPVIYRQMAQALFSDGFSPHNVARILDVSPRVVAVWIQE